MRFTSYNSLILICCWGRSIFYVIISIAISLFTITIIL